MRSIFGIALLLSTTAASADTRIFITPAVDKCLLKANQCGLAAAKTFCEARKFEKVASYRTVDPDEITGSIPKTSQKMPDHVAIVCER
jgi:hypothetical protein